MEVPLDLEHDIRTSLSNRRRCRVRWRRRRDGFQLQPPFQELHLLTEPPACGTETNFVQGTAAMLHGPVAGRLHRSPHIFRHWSQHQPQSYTLGVRHNIEGTIALRVTGIVQDPVGVPRQQKQGLEEQPTLLWPDRHSRPSHGSNISRVRACTAPVLPPVAQPPSSPQQL